MHCCRQCSRNPQEAIENRVEILGETFLKEYVQVSGALKIKVFFSALKRMPFDRVDWTFSRGHVTLTLRLLGGLLCLMLYDFTSKCRLLQG